MNPSMTNKDFSTMPFQRLLNELTNAAQEYGEESSCADNPDEVSTEYIDTVRAEIDRRVADRIFD